jgi:hypothetical protein
MMKVSIHCLYWSTVNPSVFENHKMVLDKFELPAFYTKKNIPHGMWMNNVCNNFDSDVFVFFDIDCVPLERKIFDDSLEYVIKHNTFLGNAQASNHIKPMSHVFAAPSFFMITKDCYNELGKPTFSETSRSDVAQEVSYIAEERGKRYKCIYPTKFEGIPLEGVWRLSNYGLYGIGTLFQDKIYHLFQGRFNKNVELFGKRCQEIMRDSFDMSEMHDSLGEFNGPIVA